MPGGVLTETIANLPHMDSILLSYEGCKQLEDYYNVIPEWLHRHPQENSLTLVGWSMGGLLALRAALDFPDKISRLVLVSATSSFCNRNPALGWPPRVVQRMQAALIKDRFTVMNAFVEKMFDPSEPEKGFLDSFKDLPRSNHSSTEELAAGLDVLLHTSLTDRLPYITAQVLIIQGENDTICPIQQSHQMETLLPNARAVRLSATGHAPFLTKQERFLKELREFHP